jgi:hypothetical protein
VFDVVLPASTRPCRGCGRLRKVNAKSASEPLCHECRRAGRPAKTIPSAADRLEQKRMAARARWDRPRPPAPSSQPGYISPSQCGICSECGNAMHVTPASAPPERRRCRECQKARPKNPKSDWVPQMVTCPCGKTFEQQRYGQKYCHPDHRPHAWGNGRGAGSPRKQASSSARGYGGEHKMLRRKALAELVDGSPCPRCGGAMHAGQDLDLDHADDGTGYLGLSHSECNRRAGAIRANRRRGQAA